ncbi:MAG: hypothetical protein EHM64_02945 [Ignavibacteriae bacterium]|nr:MAG: hypothetical protein EHM64_02945 [Ignavibacteriota bacterium]
METVIGSALAVLLIVFVVFLILRELMCWYWKINKIIVVLESIESKLSHLLTNSARGENSNYQSASEVKIASSEVDSNKTHVDYSDSYLIKCPNCDNKEIVKRSDFKNPAVYKNFKAESGGIGSNMKYSCNKCLRNFKL